MIYDCNRPKLLILIVHMHKLQKKLHNLVTAVHTFFDKYAQTPIKGEVDVAKHDNREF